ncbi:CsbA family protein [Lysinibacillus sp. NPDC096418]|uniref:CsbA family protein n=1 Tax=Lysinibacillus sp. NPDC096418 TaxID=3364138 RepID=UPI003819B245
MDVTGKIILALFLPAFLVIFFTRITFNRFVALVLAIALIAASVYAGYTSPPIIFVIDALSLTAGFWFASQIMNKKEN